MHCRAVALATSLALCPAASASAQSLESSPQPTQIDFSRVRARVGDFLYVSDPDRRVDISGRLTSLSADEITIDGIRFVPTPGLKIERQGDPIWNGAGIGLVLGGLAGVTVGAESCLNRSKVYCFAGSGLFGAALGASWDWLHKGRTTVFLGGRPSSLRVVPDIGTHRKAVAVVIDFR